MIMKLAFYPSPSHRRSLHDFTIVTYEYEMSFLPWIIPILYNDDSAFWDILQLDN